MAAQVYVLEGAWEKTHEPPQVLPYLLAYAHSHRTVDVYHRTFRRIEDIEYYVKRVPTGSRALFYFACHGEEEFLIPSDGRSKIPIGAVEGALRGAKEGSIAFIHFGCCHFVHGGDRRKQTLSGLRDPAQAKWVSGYTRKVDWLASTLLDLALISEVYVPWYSDQKWLSSKTRAFFKHYEQLARSLGSSTLSTQLLHVARNRHPGEGRGPVLLTN